MFLRRHLLLLSAFLLSVAVAFVGGFYTVHMKLPPYKIYRAVTKTAAQQGQSVDRVLSTIFLNLDIKKNVAHTIKTTRRGSGGGLTSFGDQVLVMNHQGHIYHIMDESADRIAIEPADYHFDEYVEASETDKYKDMWHRFNYFRYNDILYLTSAESQHLAVSYTEWIPEEECYGTAVAILDIPLTVSSVTQVEASAEDWEVVFRTQPCLPLKTVSAAIEGHMAGGRLADAGNGKIVLGSGDYAWDGLYAPEALAQDLSNDYGKVIEIDTVAGTHRTISNGHRNLQGVQVDADGQIWVVEHGARGGDELNKVIEGLNYGWPIETLGTRYNKLPWPSEGTYGRHETHTPPVFSWVPSIATSSLTQIENFHPSWDGDLLIGTFKGGNAYRVRVQDERVIFAEPLKLIDGRIRDIIQHSDGRIVVWSDAETVTFVSPGEPVMSDNLIEEVLEMADFTDAQAGKIKTTMSLCLECHSLEPFDHGNAPGLGGLYSSKIASTTYAGYSEGLKSVGGDWDESKLYEYLKSPADFAPGTIMPNPGIDDEAVIKGIVHVIKSIKEQY